MDYTAELQKILEEYQEAIRLVEKNKRPFDGLLGFGRTPGSDPCHDQMDKSVEALMMRAAGESGEDDRRACAEEADALVSALMKAEKACSAPEYARISLVAAQRHCLRLIPAMTAEGRRNLLDWYNRAYPRRMRFPIQKNIADALAK